MSRKQIIAACVACLVAGVLAGRLIHPRVTTVTEYKDRVVVQEHTVTVEKPVIEYRDRERVRTVYRDGPVKETIVYKDRSSKESGGTETTTDGTTTTDTAGRTTVAPEGRWAGRVLAGVATSGGVVAGGAVDYRLVGPLTLGAWATAPVTGSAPVTVGVSLGARF